MVKNTIVDRPRRKASKARALQKIALRLESFKDLGVNWDGDNADAVSPDALSLAQKTADELIDLGIEIEFCVPLRNGCIQFEFKQIEDFELEVHPNQALFLLRYDANATLLDKKKTTLELLKDHVRQQL